MGPSSKGGRIQCRTDNAAVVSIINSGRSKDELAMHLVRCLAFFAACFEYRVRAIHIPGRENGAADALSRNCLVQFHSQVPLAEAQPSPLPEELLDMLVHRRPEDWTSLHWSSQFSAILRKV